MWPSRDLALVVATASLVGVTLSLNFPLLSLVLEREGFDAAAIGLNATASGLGVFVLAPVLDRLLRRLGARGAIAAGILLAAVGMLLLPLRIEFGYWYAVRLLVSCGTALVFIVSEAAINALTPESHRGRVLGLYATVFSIGYTAGPAVIAVVGTGGFVPFAASALLYLCGLVPAVFARGLDRAFASGPAAPGLRYLLGIAARAPLALFAIFIFGAIETAQFALLPVYGLALGRSETQTVLMLSVWVAGNILLQYPVGWLADRMRRRLVLALCALVASLALFSLPMAVRIDAALWPTLLLLGGITGAIYTLALVLIGQTFRGIDLALANTAFVVMIHLGSMLGPGTAGAAMSAFGPHALPLALGAAMAALAAAAGCSARRDAKQPQRQRSEPTLAGAPPSCYPAAASGESTVGHDEMAEPQVAQKAPFRVEVEAGKAYFWCACGRSSKQPFCDGSHKGTEFTPIRYVAEKSGIVFFCGCKRSAKRPLCDGTHKSL